MKKKVLLLALAAILVTVASTGTVAFFTSEDTAHNVITSGGVNIEVIEQTKGENDVLIDFPEDGIKGVMPGASVSKIVQVQNTGASEAWIRIKVEYTITGSDGGALALVTGGGEQVIAFTLLDGWTSGEDGYLYYENPVAAGELTGALFDEVTFSTAMGNEYQGCTANIIIFAQAVQTANNGDSVGDAQGWPADSAD